MKGRDVRLAPCSCEEQGNAQALGLKAGGKRWEEELGAVTRVQRVGFGVASASFWLNGSV